MGQRTTRAVGSTAERAAFSFLKAKGLLPVARNFHCRCGEIDLIMLDELCLVFIEVRYRTSSSFVAASHTVDTRKQRKIVRTAAMFVARNRRFAAHTMRFDVLALGGDDVADVEWICDAFRPNDSTL